MAQKEKQPEEEAPRREVKWEPESIGERIRFLRERERMTQTQLAKRVTDLGVPLKAPMLSRYEKFGTDEVDQRRPNLFHVMAIATVLRVGLPELGVTPDEYAALRFLWDERSKKLLEDAATRVYLQGNLPRLTSMLRTPLHAVSGSGGRKTRRKTDFITPPLVRRIP